MERTDRNVDDFLAGLGGERGEAMRQLDAMITERMPGAARHLYEGTMWGGSEQQIVGYGLLDYTNRSGTSVRWFSVGLAAQKNYMSMYVNAIEEGRYLLDAYKGRLGKAKVGSAAVSFKTLEEVDLDALMEMVQRAGELAG
jgi:hypothetical protein